MGERAMKVTEDLMVSTWSEPVLDDEAHDHIAVSVQDWWEMVAYASSAVTQGSVPVPPPAPAAPRDTGSR